MQALEAFEGSILLWIQNNMRNPFLTAILRPITHLADKGAIWILLTLILLVFRRTRKAGICCACALAIMLVCNNLLIKNLVNRARPYDVVEGLTTIVGEQDDPSFPSGHTAVSFAATMALFLSLPLVTDRKKTRLFGILALILSVLIGFSRLYVGVHYPTDVLGGLLLGILYGIAGYHAGLRLIRFMAGRWPKVFPEEDAPADA